MSALLIKESILDLFGTCPKTAGILMDNWNKLTCANYSKKEAEELIFEDDALDSGEVADETALWVEIRDLQRDMVDHLSECPF